MSSYGRVPAAAALCPVPQQAAHVYCAVDPPSCLCVCRADGPLLSAVRGGAWVLLDELNLASQTVLEGLNAVLDHRAEVGGCGHVQGA